MNTPAARTMDSYLVVVCGEIKAAKLRPHIVHSNKVVNGANEGFSVGDEKDGSFTPQGVTASTENVQEFVSVHAYIVINGDKVVTALLFTSVPAIFSYIVNSNRICLYSYANCSCFNEGRWLEVPGHSGSCCGGSGRKCGSSSVQRRPRHEAPGQGGTGRPVFI